MLTTVICYLDESEPLTLIRSANIISEYIRRFDSDFTQYFIIEFEVSKTGREEAASPLQGPWQGSTKLPRLGLFVCVSKFSSNISLLSVH